MAIFTPTSKLGEIVNPWKAIEEKVKKKTSSSKGPVREIGAVGQGFEPVATTGEGTQMPQSNKMFDTPFKFSLPDNINEIDFSNLPKTSAQVAQETKRPTPVESGGIIPKAMALETDDQILNSEFSEDEQALAKTMASEGLVRADIIEGIRKFRNGEIDVEGNYIEQAQPTEQQPAQQQATQPGTQEGFQYKEYIPTAPKFQINTEPTTGIMDSNVQLAGNLLKTVGNVPSGIWNTFAGTVNTVVNTADDPKGMGEAIVTGIKNAYVEGKESVKDEYEKNGTMGVISKALEKSSETLGENPFETIALVKPSVGLDVMKKTATAPIKGAGKLASELLGKTTGTSGETIRTAFKTGDTPEFKSALRGQTKPQDILANAKEGLQTIRDTRPKLYGADYEKLKVVKKKIPLNFGKDSQTASVIKSIKDDYNVKPIFDTKGNLKSLDFSESKITGATSQAQIKDIVTDIQKWKDTTPAGLDILKQRIQDYYRGTPDSAMGDRISTMASKMIKSKIVDAVPEYAKMTAKFEKMTNDIRDITKTLSLGDKAQAQTAITKLSSVLRDNFPARQDMLKIIEEFSGKNLQAEIAGASLNPPLARGLAGVITGGGVIAGGGLTVLTNPGFWAGLSLASPRLMGEVAAAVGTTTAKLSTAVNNIKKYLPNTPLINKAVKYAIPASNPTVSAVEQGIKEVKPVGQ